MMPTGWPSGKRPFRNAPLRHLLPNAILRNVDKLRWANVVALLAAPCAVAAAAPWVADWHWSLDLAACFVVQGGAVVAGATIFFASQRKWAPCAVAAAFTAMAAGAVLPGWQDADNSPQDGESSPDIQVLSLNLLQNNELGREQACEVVRAARPDLVWFTEYTPAWQRHLRRALPELPHRLERPDFGSFGAALYSRHPFSVREMVPGGQLWSPFGRAVVETPHGPIAVLGVHPPPPLPGAARVAERDRGLSVIPSLLAGLPARRVVLGDFNATPWNPTFERARRAAGLSRGSSSEWLPTWPASLPAAFRLPIDHVLVGGDLAVVHASLGAPFGSDHLPLVATVRIGR